MTLVVLARAVPTDVMDTVSRETGRQNWRAPQLLPRVIVYYVMALTLYAHASCDAVLRQLLEGLWLVARGRTWAWRASRPLPKPGYAWAKPRCATCSAASPGRLAEPETPGA